MASEIVVFQLEEYLRIYLVVLIYEFIRFAHICTISSYTEGYERKRVCAEFFFRTVFELFKEHLRLFSAMGSMQNCWFLFLFMYNPESHLGIIGSGGEVRLLLNRTYVFLVCF